MSGASTVRKFLCAFWLGAVSVSIGLNWTALQMAAWAGMTITNAHTMELPLALEKAMSVDQPCLVCRFANQQRESDSESPWNPSQSAFELEGVMADYKIVLNCSFPLVMPVRDNAFLLRCVPPPHPPPEKFFNYTS